MASFQIICQPRYQEINIATPQVADWHQGTDRCLSKDELLCDYGKLWLIIIERRKTCGNYLTKNNKIKSSNTLNFYISSTNELNFKKTLVHGILHLY